MRNKQKQGAKTHLKKNQKTSTCMKKYLRSDNSSKLSAWIAVLPPAMLSVSQSVSCLHCRTTFRTFHSPRETGGVAEQTGHPKDAVSDSALLPPWSFCCQAAYRAKWTVESVFASKDSSFVREFPLCRHAAKWNSLTTRGKKLRLRSTPLCNRYTPSRAMSRFTTSRDTSKNKTVSTDDVLRWPFQLWRKNNNSL